MPKLATPLSDLRIKAAKPKDKPYQLADGGGMHLDHADWLQDFAHLIITGIWVDLSKSDWATWVRAIFADILQQVATRHCRGSLSALGGGLGLARMEDG